MAIYDEVAVNERTGSPVSTAYTDTCASSPTTSVGTQCPIYENVEEFSQLCQFRPSSVTRKTTALSMDFIKNIPPPSLGIPVEKNNECEYGSSSRLNRPLDMRPLSFPIYQMRQMQKRENHWKLIIFLSVTTVLVIAVSVSIWFFFADIERHYHKLMG